MSRLGISYPEAEVHNQAAKKTTIPGANPEWLASRAHFHRRRFHRLRSAGAPIVVIKPVDLLIEIYDRAVQMKREQERLAL